MSWSLQRVAPLSEERITALHEIAQLVGRTFDAGEEFRVGRRRYTVEREAGTTILTLRGRSLATRAKDNPPASANQLQSFSRDVSDVIAQAAERLPARIDLRRDRVETLRAALPEGEIPRLDTLQTRRTASSYRASATTMASVGSPAATQLDAIAGQTPTALGLRDELIMATKAWAARLVGAIPDTGGCIGGVTVKAGGRPYFLDRVSMTTRPGGFRTAYLHGLVPSYDDRAIVDDVAVADRFAYDLPSVAGQLAAHPEAGGPQMRQLSGALNQAVASRSAMKVAQTAGL